MYFGDVYKRQVEEYAVSMHDQFAAFFPTTMVAVSFLLFNLFDSPCLAAISTTAKAVSYTHLDVYKRQGQLRAVQYRDIVILSRSVATWGNTVAAVLKEMCIRDSCMLCKGRPGNRYRSRPAVSYPLYQTCRLKGRQLVASPVSTGAWTCLLYTSRCV